SEKEAQTEAATSDQMVEFFRKMLEGVGPSVALGRDTTLLREILDKAADRISTDLTNQPDLMFQMRWTIGSVYHEIAELGKAETSFRLALGAARELAAANPGAVTRVGLELLKLGETLQAQRRVEEAEPLFREALAIFKDLPNKKDQQAMVGVTLDDL